VRWDRERMTHALDERGRLVLAGAGEPALLAVRVSDEEIETLGDARGLVRDAFGDGTAWLVTNDVLERDAAGKHWFVDSLSGFVRPANGGDPVSLRRVEDALYALPEVQLAAAWEASRGSGEIAAAFVSRIEIAPERIEEALKVLPPSARPKRVARVPSIPLTEGFRPKKRVLPTLSTPPSEETPVSQERPRSRTEAVRKP